MKCKKIVGISLDYDVEQNVQGEIKKLVLKGENKNGKNNKRRFY